MPSSLLQLAHQVQDLRLDRDVERGGRLVGDQQGRAADQRHRQHGALPQTARQFERVHLVGALGVLEADESEHVLASSCCSPLVTGRCSRSASWIWLPMLWTGESDDIGSWKIMPMRPPRRRPDLRPVAPQARDVDRCRVAAGIREQDLPAQDQAVAGQQAHHALRNDRLAGSGLPDQRHRLAGRNPKRDTLDDFRAPPCRRSRCGDPRPAGCRVRLSGQGSSEWSAPEVRRRRDRRRA